MAQRREAFKNNRTTDLIKLGADPLAVAIEACRKRNIEAFYTIRVNDIHDNFWYEMLSQWKKDHPDLLLGKREDKKTYPFSDSRHVWTLADFGRKEVRDRMVTIVADIPDRYDVDGIDLDFLRLSDRESPLVVRTECCGASWRACARGCWCIINSDAVVKELRRTGALKPPQSLDKMLISGEAKLTAKTNKQLIPLQRKACDLQTILVAIQADEREPQSLRKQAKKILTWLDQSLLTQLSKSPSQ